MRERSSAIKTGPLLYRRSLPSNFIHVYVFLPLSDRALFRGIELIEKNVTIVTMINLINFFFDSGSLFEIFYISMKIEFYFLKSILNKIIQLLKFKNYFFNNANNK